VPRSGPRAVGKCSDEFKLTAVRPSRQPGMLVKTVAAALEIHPWRQTASTQHRRRVSNRRSARKSFSGRVWRA
jgi:transposase-like protein